LEQVAVRDLREQAAAGEDLEPMPAREFQESVVVGYSLELAEGRNRPVRAVVPNERRSCSLVFHDERARYEVMQSLTAFGEEKRPITDAKRRKWEQRNYGSRRASEGVTGREFATGAVYNLQAEHLHADSSLPI